MTQKTRKQGSVIEIPSNSTPRYFPNFAWRRNQHTIQSLATSTIQWITFLNNVIYNTTGNITYLRARHNLVFEKSHLILLGIHSRIRE
jgi:hypothetical protein